MRALLYARVSTSDKEQDPRPQLEEMREFCRHRRWTIAAEYVEKISTAKARPEFSALRAAVRSRRGDVVLCRHFDRVARSTRELLELLEEFKALEVDFVSLNQQIDTTTPAGKLMFTLIAAFAEFERAMTRERVMLGLAAARASGTRLGRPPLEPDSDKIRMLWQSGLSVRSIAAEVRVSASSVRRVLKSPANAPKTPSRMGAS